MTGVLGKTDTDNSELRSWCVYVWVFRRNDDIYEPTMHHIPRTPGRITRFKANFVINGYLVGMVAMI